MEVDVQKHEIFIDNSSFCLRQMSRLSQILTNS